MRGRGKGRLERANRSKAQTRRPREIRARNSKRIASDFLLFLAFAHRFGAGVKEYEARVLIVDGKADGPFVSKHVHDADQCAAFEEDFCAAEIGGKDGLRNRQAVVNEFDLGDFTLLPPKLELARSAEARVKGVVVLFDVVHLERHE